MIRRLSLLTPIDRRLFGRRTRPKATYLAKHPNAFWIEFGDFNWFRVSVIMIYLLRNESRIDFRSVDLPFFYLIGSHIISPDR